MQYGSDLIRGVTLQPDFRLCFYTVPVAAHPVGKSGSFLAIDNVGLAAYQVPALLRSFRFAHDNLSSRSKSRVTLSQFNTY